MESNSDTCILLAKDAEFCAIQPSFRSGYYRLIWTGPLQMVVPAIIFSPEEYGRAHYVFLTNGKACYICWLVGCFGVLRPFDTF